MRRRVIWLIVILAFSVPLHGSLSARAAQARVDPALSRALDQHPGGVSFIVLLRDKTDLSAAVQIRERTARAQAVARALRETARRSQAPLITLLQQMQGTGWVRRFQSFFSVNALGVVGTREAVAALAAHPAVEAIELDPVITLPPVSAGSPQPQINGVEWNIDRIQADAVWALLGYTGAGVTVANIDTGVRFTHEALIKHYLCGPSGPHDRCWFDVVNGLNDFPYDDSNHGTHTMGIAVGGTPDHLIGVAPEAKWIACKAFDANNSGPGTAVLACSDFLVPLAPAVINNSWGYFTSTFFEGMVNSWLAAGIFPAFANGNEGPGCSTTLVPAAYAQSFGVGATDMSDTIAFFSSRGPSQVDPFPIKPDASAPGVDVRSSVAISDTDYRVFSGTSMATPHVTGTVALLLSKNPSLTVDQLSSLLETNADVFVDTQCGGDEPNNVYGWGRINAYNAVVTAPSPP